MLKKETSGSRRNRVGAIAAVAGSIIIAGTGTAVWASNDPPQNRALPPLGRSGGLTASSTPHAVSPNVKTSSEPPLGPVPAVTSGARIAMPLDPFMTSMSDLKLIDEAANLKARDCMRSLGFSTWTADIISTSKPDGYKDSDLLEYLDPAKAAKNGFPTTLVDKEDSSSREAPSTAKPSSDAIRAFTGSEPRTGSGRAIPRGGCNGEGSDQVRLGGADLPADPRALAATAKFAAKRDSRMQSSFKSWNTCMAQQGFHYNDPLSASNDPHWGLRKAATPAGVQEKKVAAADATCQEKINLVGTYKALEIAYQKRSVDQYRTELTAALATFNKWTARAKAILADG